MSLTNYAEDLILNSAEMFGQDVTIALSTADPTEDGSGLAEPAGGGYARVTVTNGGFSVTSGVASNDNAIDFGTASGASWGTVTHFAIFDSADTNMIAYGALTTSRTIADGDSANFAAGALTVSLD